MKRTGLFKENKAGKQYMAVGVTVVVCIATDIYFYHKYNSLFTELFLTLSYLLIIAAILILCYYDKKINNRDIEASERLMEEIKEKEKRFRSTLNSFNDVYWQYNLDTKELELSDRWTLLTGCTNHCAGELTDLMGEIIHKEDINVFNTSFNNYLKELTPFFECSFRIKDTNGDYKWFYIKGIKEHETSEYFHEDINFMNETNNNQKSSLITGLISDVTVRRNFEEKITHMAYYDSLTELPNKIYIQNHLKDSIENAIKNDTKGALVFIDIDDFKIVNTTFGHDYGDQLLKIISELLKITLGDDRMISRIGGDEFLLVLDEIDDKKEVEAICLSIISMFKYPFEIGDKSIYSSVSIGAVVFPEDGTEVNELFRNADASMHKSKERSKNTYCFFDTCMTVEFERKTRIGNLLREAIDKNEMSVYYQPLYSSVTEKVISMEALIRWHSEELGEVSPSEFIPIAESTGTINSIGKWVFEQVCKQNCYWKQKGYVYDSIAVNISTIQIQSESFVSMIKTTILENNIEPSSIELEITESALMKNISFSERKLHELKRMGINIAIDDFGTGYSSLNYLTYLPLNTLKIDKAFIDNITTIKNDKILVSNIIKLSHDLDIKVVAEGVEMKEQLEMLKNMNCDIIQGFYYSKPLAAEKVEEKLQKRDNGGETDGI